jgi:hypothetical protein
MPEPLNWLSRTNEIPAVWEELSARFGKERIDAICAGRWYELAHAVTANALGMAIDTTGLSPRKKRRMGSPMLNLMFQALPLVFMFGYAARYDEEWMANAEKHGSSDA